MENNFLIDSDLLTESGLKRKHQIETDPSSRINHMEYLPGMDVIESDIRKCVMEHFDSYDYSKYTAKDVKRALDSVVPPLFIGKITFPQQPRLHGRCKRRKLCRLCGAG